MLMTMNRIARRLRDFRLGEHRNQEGVAKVAGMAQSAWAGWEKNPPKALQSLVDLAVHYGVSTDYLVALTDDPTPRRIALEGAVDELIQIASKLPKRRQDDLLLIARSYLDEYRNAPHDDQQLIASVMGLIQEYGGQRALDSLMDFLDSSNGDSLFGDDAEQPPHSDR